MEPELPEKCSSGGTSNLENSKHSYRFSRSCTHHRTNVLCPDASEPGRKCSSAFAESGCFGGTRQQPRLDCLTLGHSHRSGTSGNSRTPAEPDFGSGSHSPGLAESKSQRSNRVSHPHRLHYRTW